MGFQVVALLSSIATFTSHFLNSMFDIKASVPSHVLELLLMVSMCVLPIRIFFLQNANCCDSKFYRVKRTVTFCRWFDSL